MISISVLFRNAFDSIPVKDLKYVNVETVLKAFPRSTKTVSLYVKKLLYPFTYIFINWRQLKVILNAQKIIFCFCVNETVSTVIELHVSVTPHFRLRQNISLTLSV